MVCKNCNHDIPDNSKFCINCGSAVTDAPDQAMQEPSVDQQANETTILSQPQMQQNPAQQNQYQYYNPQMQQPMMQHTPAFDPNNIPEKYKPLSPWTYFWCSILFYIPVIGFIFLLIFTFGASNINLRNYARSYWCGLLIVLIIAMVIVVIGASISASIF